MSRQEHHAIGRQGLSSASYDEQARTLQIEFSGGRSYEYYDVPRSAFDWLCRTRTPGSYVTRMISRRYAYRALAPAGSAPDPDLLRLLTESVEGLKDNSC